ncbi:hypothetical protein AXJ14_gp059 [Geobacillus virus E3]|uniref:hypothetical protein n=1 Tax=Geobacillus virus E3 TaxID=1572712 RepID=UPI00067185D4|nr:hypothetical protein AXJ14_gp059 [Geobacillus virus E3]AJA41378.1 hypothetical protein E3_059 [Geobacillus virus E3]
MKLYDYQREIIESNENKIMMNWARCNGKTYTIANYIKEKRPKEVLWANFANKLNNLQEKFNELLHMDDEFKNSLSSFKLSNQEIYFKYHDGSYTKIKLLNRHELKDFYQYEIKKKVDLIVYDDCYPFDTGYVADKIICSITENNYDKHLQQSYPDFFISEKDYRTALDVGLMTNEIIQRIKEENPEQFLKEFAILDSLYGDSFVDLNLFVTKTIRQLIYEYERIPSANNTVLTRKNIIEMIKTLKELNN